MYEFKPVANPGSNQRGSIAVGVICMLRAMYRQHWIAGWFYIGGGGGALLLRSVAKGGPGGARAPQA